MLFFVLFACQEQKQEKKQEHESAFKQKDLDKIRSKKQCPKCDLRKAGLQRASLSGASLREANLSGAKLNGADLFDATHIHRLLQKLLGLKTPEWHHSPLLKDEFGKRLSKSEGASTLRELRQKGVTKSEIWSLAIQNLATSSVKNTNFKS